jgi:hypothetical protein
MTTLGTVILTAGLLGAGDWAQGQAVLRDPAFEITMPPGVPVPTTTKVADASGVDYSAQTATGVYRVQYTEMPSDDADKLFESIRTSLKAGMTLTSHEPFVHQGHRGLRMFITMPALNQVVRMDSIMVGKRLYRVWFIARTMPELDTAPVRAFFDSFKIL